ncbi:MAG: TonB-dependent receptor [Muribaculaceae bacterium]|nr:TonB-dependent receptor [Muribaculaceae bacterium]
MFKRLHFLSFMAMLLVAIGMNAQVTTSALSVKVTDDLEEELIGATVRATHLPSGTKYHSVSNLQGMAYMQGMRTGGPYRVEVSYIGYETRIVEGVVLELGNTYNLSVHLSASSSQLGEVEVVGKGSKFSNEKMGATTNITSAQLTALPTVTRNLTDATRLSPYGGNGMNFVGTDGRTSNFTIDGANFNNNFGLNDGLPGGGNPISMEAIEEMQVVISPYDVRQTNFIGGGVNAITKSGTNTFRGSAYFYHRNENMRGDAVDRVQIGQAREKSQYTTWGLTLGGPIIKDKLFFFVNGEMTKHPTITNTWVASTNGVAIPDQYVSRTSLADLKTVSDFVRSKYGYDTGSYTSFPADEKNNELLVRLDWNINTMHHLALRYNYTKNFYWQNPNASSMDGGTRMPSARMSQKSFSFANSMYSMDNLVHSFSFDLNSRLSDNLSNQFLATFSKLDDVRGSNSKEFPFIDITMTDAEGNRDNYMALGYELFTWNNGVHNTVWTVRDDITYYYGRHIIMGGLSYEHQMADNAYMRNGTGYYRYNTLEDFLNGAAPEVVCLTYGYDGESNPAARVRFNKLGIYGQDEWNITDRFKLTAGLRIDGLFFNNGDLMTNGVRTIENLFDGNGNVVDGITVYDKNGKLVTTRGAYPLYNSADPATRELVRSGILGLDYSGGRHIDTGKWPSANVIFQPRVGFSWDVLGDKTLKLRGGTGLFSGRLPLVFFTNMPTNSGMVQYQAQLTSKNADMSQFAGGLVTDPSGNATIDALKNKLFEMGYPSTVTPRDGSVPSSISAVDPKFKMPQEWKTSLAVDYTLPVKFPFSITAEAIFNKTVNGVTISDWSMNNVGGFARFNGVDNRPIYPTDFRSGTKAFVLENTSKGYGWSASVSLNARPVEWLSLMAAYTHVVRKELTSLPGSAAESAFTYVPTVEGPNYIKLHNSQNVTPDRFVVSAIGHDRSGNHYGLVYESWRGGYNYSYMLMNDMNGDGYQYDALYVPTDDQVKNGEFRFVSADDQQRFMDYVHNNSYLSNQQGKYAEAYSLYSPWVHRFDLSYKHDFSLHVAGAKHTLQLSFDIKNVFNLFNSSWGVSKYLNPEIGSDARILKYEGIDAQGYATFSTPSSINGNTKTFVPNKAIGQCWNASIGIKYIFN